MRVHLVDGTYELFRCFFGAPSKKVSGREIGATRALMRSLAAWLRTGQVTHLALAFDTVIESFRNQLFVGYKTGEGIDPDLFSQFELVERAVAAMGIVVWPMVKFEADDAMAAGAELYSKSKKVEQVLLCSPDKDLAQCVRDKKIAGFDRQKNLVLDEAAVKAKFGVPPSSIPDLLALVGDTADGIPGIPRWGMKSASAVLSAYGSVEKIPKLAKDWKIVVRGADALAENLANEREAALLYRKLATLRTDVPLKESLEDLEWKGAKRKKLEAFCEEIEEKDFLKRLPLII